MADLDYKPNSHKYKAEQAKEERTKLEPVAQGKTKKKSGARKITDVFISEDVNNVKSYIMEDVLIPSIKDAIAEVITNGVNMMLFGETKRSSKSSTASRVSYRNYYDRKDDRRSSTTSRVRTGYDLDDIVLETRGEAEEVLDRLTEILDTYTVATVADLYDLVGITCPYTATKYGWTNLRNADVVRVRDGYILKLPKAVTID